ncbi:MAG TPA: AIR synthase related protein, partial [Anaeromyxobacteraceae bacterium]|nr:AIR synthase related protein [Anaeromyxobacteraceae bacterium]
TNTVVGPGASDAAVVRLKGTNRGLAVKTDCNGRYVYLNPRKGGQIAVAEAARNVVCAGGKPLAVTNCLNFGNPYKPEVYWVFKEAVGGMGDACRAFDTPVTGGNVSFYNENPEGAVFPTPTIGMLGLVDDVEKHATTADFKAAGDCVYLLTPKAWLHAGGIEGSEYLATVHGRTAGDAPLFELGEEKAVQEAALALIRAGLVRSAHDVADGGLAVCLAESALYGRLGAEVTLRTPEGETPMRLDALLFGEAQSRIVLSVRPEAAEAAERLARHHAVAFTRVGGVGGDALRIAVDGTMVVNEPVAALAEAYETAIPAAMGERVNGTAVRA